MVFDEIVEAKHFTQKGADIPIVKDLYRSIFPTLCTNDTNMDT